MQSEVQQSVRANRVIAVVLFAGSLGLYALFWFAGYSDYFGNVFGDVALTAAERVQAGDIPYRDFWTMYAPGSFYLLALLFGIFGNHYLVSAIAASVLCAASVSLCYLLVSAVLQRTLPALASALVFLAATLSGAYFVSLAPYPPTVFLVLCAFWCLARFYHGQQRGWLFAAGLASGAVILFKHDVGGYTCIAISVGLLLAFIPRLQVAACRAWAPVPALLCYASGVALVSLPVAAYLVAVAGPDMWRDLIVFPATDFHITRGEHYPELIPTGFQDRWWLRTLFNLLYNLQFTLPFLVIVVAALYLAGAVWRGRVSYQPLAASFLVAYLLHYLSAHVQINTNIMSMALYAGMLGAIAFDSMERVATIRQRFWLRLTAGLLTAVLLFAYTAETFYWRLRSAPGTVTLTLPKLSGLRVLPDKAETLQQLVSYIDTHVPPGRKIFVGLHRHDTVVIGDGKMYFILDRANATRQDQLHPGIVDTAEIQQQMIADLQREDVRYIVIRHVFDDQALDRLRKIWAKTLPRSGATLLDSYIGQHFHTVLTTGQYEIRVRNDVDPDQDVRTAAPSR